MADVAYGGDDKLRQVPADHGTGDPRSEFQHDRDRIIHSLAFRRLQGKTQVYGLGASDYYRTRLTHSLEVAQIGRSLAVKHGADPDLVEAICLAHDIGHPPFGHAGESVLHAELKDWGGFNGNAQNLRILAVLEQKSPAYSGLNLTTATMDGLVKYPYPINPHLDRKLIASKKGYYKRDEAIVQTFRPADKDRKTFECEIMNWADDVAYSSHDLEDALVIGTIRRDDLELQWKLDEIAEHATQSYASEHQELSDTAPMDPKEIKDWVERIIKDCIVASTTSNHRLAVIKQYVSRHIDQCVAATSAPETGESPARYSKRLEIEPAIVKKVEIFKAVVFVSVIRTSPVYTLQHAGVKILRELFQALIDVGNENLMYLFPLDIRRDADASIRAYRAGTDRERLYEFVRDFLASMTDANCEALWRRMFSPGGGLFMARV
jgi:dGTPase